MAQNNHEQYNNSSLEELGKMINEDYYDIIELLIRQIKERKEHLMQNRLSDKSLSYLAVCDQLLAEVEKYVAYRKQSFLPYISELNQKDLNGHNCSNCSGRCDMEHSARLIDFTISLKNIKKIIYDIKAAILQAYTINNEELKIIHEQIMQLDSIVNELLYKEEEHLLPKIKDAQRNIHANE